MADINGVLERLVKYKILVVEGPGKDAFCAVGLAMGPKKCIKFISTVSLCYRVTSLEQLSLTEFSGE